MNTLLLYLRAHGVNSAEAAVELAETTPTAKHINFARRLLHIKMTPGNPQLHTRTEVNGNMITRSAKYNYFLERLAQLERKIAQTDSPLSEESPLLENRHLRTTL